MLTILDLDKISVARLRDAEALYTADRYDGAYYMAGYSLELASLAKNKRAICSLQFRH
ncbi:hypothetical protein [Duganella radicis]|uniref:HEPN domain-containing protein n=1 Tax=Duganella radicis TaxID=551988 RepID=A0A6L6PQR6_9BURK|nr:hypothetical protein [Duganella radicis]MTV41139.1 hypothetical protein [Duganella radicis]